jgi:anti-sigma regulatory factor (Ser/Thr protein kinase)
VCDVEILGKASLVEPEVTQEFLNQEKGSYTLGNNVTHAEILSQRISDRISIHFAPNELNSLRTCFREILINAIEHGNLGITFDEKTQALQGGDYMEFLTARQKENRFAARRVHVFYVINKKMLVLRVTDEGDGFDHEGFLERSQSDESFLYLEHGRGITMAQGAFDSVEFNKKGNQVTLTKRITT